jgi:hypothetical protein
LQGRAEVLRGPPSHGSITAADKFKIEIVETTMTVGLVSETLPGNPEQITTHCNKTGTDCNSTVIPATDPSNSVLPEILSFEAKATFPDGSHVKLMCFSSRSNKKCKGIEPNVAPKTPDMCFMNAIAAFVAEADVVGATKSCTAKTSASIRRNGNMTKERQGLIL